MYVGRIVSVALTANGRWCAAYRVSSRSFPNRTAVLAEDKVSIVPKPGFEADVQKNPYIAYNCVRIVCGGQVAVVTNGSQTDPIAEKIMSGMSPRDALVVSLLALDYEKDSYNTPRICAVADRRNGGAGWLGVVRENGLNVRRMGLNPGRFFYVATYEECSLRYEQGGEYPVETPEQACDFILSGGVFSKRKNAVTAVAAMSNEHGFDLATKDAAGA